MRKFYSKVLYVRLAHEESVFGVDIVKLDPDRSSCSPTHQWIPHVKICLLWVLEHGYLAAELLRHKILAGPKRLAPRSPSRRSRSRRRRLHFTMEPPRQILDFPLQG